ncbi:hypothetical protein [Streptococcus pneumoniae]|uniref:hypothetical protein n=1 Tax=Streptococcus pneumoniae TaxID=1313 RepID=UPI00214DD946|nr:hypothetical protein [Streptococcus pneumoniae]
MKIKEQTRKLATGCSKHRFEVVDKTDEVCSKHCFEVSMKTKEQTRKLAVVAQNTVLRLSQNTVLR